MRKSLLVAVVLSILFFVTGANATAISASAFLSGGVFLQGGTITNNSTTGLNIISITYSLGTPANGVATWENFFESPAGFVKSAFLTDGVHFQTISWGGLSIAPAGTFNFGGLDIDLIVTLLPLNVTGSVLDTVGTSLQNASVSVVFSNGATASARLVQQSWSLNQNLTLGPRSEAPEPSTLSLMAVGIGLVAAARRRIKL